MRGRPRADTAPRDTEPDHTTSATGPRRFTVTETREAWLVTADNLDEVAAWCGGGRAGDDLLWYPIPETPYGDTTALAEIGDVLVKDPRRFYDVPDWLFERDCAPRWTEVGS